MENGDWRCSTALEVTEEFKLLMAYTKKSVTRTPDRAALVSKKMRKKKDVVDRLARIVESLHIAPSDIESDSSDDVIQTIVDLLRESGDRLNEEIKKNKTLSESFRSFNYELFKVVANLFVKTMEPPQASDLDKRKRVEIALTFEVTRRLTAVQYHPMNMLMGFGAKYLQDNFSTWAQQHGGWEKAFDTGDNDEVQ